MCEELMDYEVYVPGYGKKYIFNKLEKKVYKTSTMREVKIGPKYIGGGHNVHLKNDGDDKYTEISMIRMILDINTIHNRNDGLYPIVKDGDLSNFSYDNILLGDIYTRYYYRYCHNDPKFTEKYLVGRCCVINETYQECMDRGGIPVTEIVGFKNHLIDVKGNIFSKSFGKQLKTTPNDCGYSGIGLQDKKGKVKTFNVIRLVAEAFIPRPSKKHNIVRFKVFKNRAEVNINNLEWYTRSGSTKKCHIDNPGYTIPNLKPAPLRIKLTVNDIVFKSITEASEYISKDMFKTYGIHKSTSSIKSCITNRFSGKSKNKKLYKKYTVKKVI